MTYKIPFNKPFTIGKELHYVAESVIGLHTSGDGPFTKQCHTILEDLFAAKKVLLTTSCTSALEIAAFLCDFRPGDEVIMPSYTFVSTANAFYLRGAQPKFIDIRTDTLNLDENLLESAITERTKAIVPVHYAGMACDMDEINRIASKHGLMVIEDAAQGVNAKYKGRFLGTLGNLGTYSFHETKNVICGEGGALLINDEALIERAEMIREKGTNRSQFLRGQVDKYTWVSPGSSYLLSDLLAAYLLGQLEHLEEITQRRESIFQRYQDSLLPLSDAGHLILPTVPETCSPNYHMFQILVRDLETRTALIDHLKARGILAIFHYVPLHTSPMGESLGYHRGMLPVTEDISDRLLRLPFFFELKDEEIDVVTQEISSFFNHRSLGG